MMLSRAAGALLIAFVVACAVSGCGESGSDPPLYPEVQFEVRPRSGKAKFVVESLTAENVVHNEFPDPADPSRPTEFTTTGLFSFYLLNAAPPYSGRFRATEGEIEVTLYVRGKQEGIRGEESNGTVVVPPGAPPPPANTSPSKEIRIDVCGVLANQASGSSSCNTAADPPGTFGIVYDGSVGDPYITRTAQGPTPAVYFLENAEATVNGVFTASPGGHLNVFLIIDHDVHDIASGRENVSVREDI